MDVYDGVPTIVTAWLTTMPKISLFLFLLEFQEFALLYNWSTWTQLLLFSSMLSFIVGALSQYRVKRLLAYSSISHVGFLILALAVNSVSSVNSLLFYLVLTTFFGNMYNPPLYLFLTLLLHSLHLLALYNNDYV